MYLLNLYSASETTVKVRKLSSSVTVPENPKPGKGFSFLWLVALIGVSITLWEMAGAKKSPIVIDEKGNATLAPHREKKLQKELGEIDNAVQYALRASESGYFPCYTCPDGKGTIYLQKGEVWRYGTTRKGENGRYPSGDYGVPNLTFVPEFVGTYSECLKMEKTKIYHYPLLPEALKRDFILAIPPGNLIDH